MKDKALQVWLTKEELSILYRTLRMQKITFEFTSDKLAILSAIKKLEKALNK